MGGRSSTATEDNGEPVPTKRGREEAIAWARAIVARGIRVIRLRSGKTVAKPRVAPIALTSDPQP